MASSVLVSCENKSPLSDHNVVDSGNVMTDSLNFLNSETDSHSNHNLVSVSSVIRRPYHYHAIPPTPPPPPPRLTILLLTRGVRSKIVKRRPDRS